MATPGGSSPVSGAPAPPPQTLRDRHPTELKKIIFFFGGGNVPGPVGCLGPGKQYPPPLLGGSAQSRQCCWAIQLWSVAPIAHTDPSMAPKVSQSLQLPNSSPSGCTHPLRLSWSVDLAHPPCCTAPCLTTSVCSPLVAFLRPAYPTQS